MVSRPTVDPVIQPGDIETLVLYYFLGFTIEEIGELLGLSKATIDRELKFARGWVQERLSPDEG